MTLALRMTRVDGSRMTRVKVQFAARRAAGVNIADNCRLDSGAKPPVLHVASRP